MRDNYSDFLRFIGLSAIILVHCIPPPIISQLRAFDVCLMVFVSGLAVSVKPIKHYRVYMWQRTKRLVFPVWIFLAFSLSYLFVGHFVGIFSTSLTWENIWDSFMLRKGIGYVWIFRIFLLMTLVTPILQRINKKVRTDIGFVGIIVIGLIIQGVLAKVYVLLNATWQNNIEYYVMDTIGYGMLYLLGMRLYSNKYRGFWLFVATIILAGGIILYIYINGLPITITPNYKYPPYSFYLLYGIVVSVILWYSKPIFKRVGINRLFIYIGKNTCWIYLWHIPFIAVANSLIPVWWFRYIFVYFISIACYALQCKIIQRSLKNTSFKKYLI